MQGHHIDTKSSTRKQKPGGVRALLRYTSSIHLIRKKIVERTQGERSSERGLAGERQTHLSQERDVVEVEQGGGLLDRAALHEGEVSGHPGVDDGAALLLRESNLVKNMPLRRGASKLSSQQQAADGNTKGCYDVLRLTLHQANRGKALNHAAVDGDTRRKQHRRISPSAHRTQSTPLNTRSCRRAR